MFPDTAGPATFLPVCYVYLFNISLSGTLESMGD